MAPSPSLELSSFYSQLKFLLRQQAQKLSFYSKLKHTLAGEGMEAQSCVKKDDKCRDLPGRLEMSRWKKVNSRSLGVESSMIPESPLLVLKLLRNKGFQAYLVGGCVRDLLLKRVPKDFDVITTANLKKIRKIFHNAHIVGRRFPICMVSLKGSVVEVSSFQTVASHGELGEKTQSLEVPSGYNELEFIRWRDSKRRDYTINSMFYDPFSNSIFDYANGMKDLSSSRLKTLIPAEVSFKQDCARILRGLRIAARLGLSFSKDTETAISNLSFSIHTLAKSRLMMELNYMFSYGAAEPSIRLLRKFNLLEFLLPIQDAYLKQQHKDQAPGKSVMLMKLLSSLDQVVGCDKPCDCTLWIGLLAFHQALVASPQDSLVLWTLTSVLYHGEWSKALKAAREHEKEIVDFEPEILSETNDHQLSDDELVERVSKFASTIKQSIYTFCFSNCLDREMSERYPSSSCSGLVLVSKKACEDVARIFDVLLDRAAAESHSKTRVDYEINYRLLEKGNVFEKRFVIGKIIMDTMGNAVTRETKTMAAETIKETNHQQISDKKCEVGSSRVGVEEKVSEDSFDKLIGRLAENREEQKRIKKVKNSEDVLDKTVGRLREKTKKRKQIDKVDEIVSREEKEGSEKALKKGKVDEIVGGKENMNESSTENAEGMVLSVEGKVNKIIKKDGSDKKKKLKRKEQVLESKMESTPKVTNISKKPPVKKEARAKEENKAVSVTAILSSLFK